MATGQKVLLVGWDAADWKMIHPLMDRGLMPATKRLVEGGTMANLTTLSPVLSPMLWTSIATGKRPFKHGILGFTEPTPDGTAVQPVSGLSRRTKAIWNILNQEGRRSLVVGWWPSHPAEPIDGVMVSNHYHRAPRGPEARWPMAKGTVHPPEMAEALAELRFHPLEVEEAHIRPFIPLAEKIDQDNDSRLDGCLRIFAECTTVHACATHLLENEDWDFAAVYYDAIDHFGHGFMKYHPPRQPFVSEDDFEIYQNVVSAGYVYHDMMLGRLMELAGEGTTVVLVSDHGFHPDHLRPDGIPNEPAGPAIEHRDLGIFAMAGPGIRRDALVSGATLLDVTPTILAHLGLPVGADMDGHPLLQVFETAPEVRTIPSWDEVVGDDGSHPAGFRIETSQSDELLQQLVDLGYVDRPDEDRSKAVADTQRENDYNLAMAYMDAARHPKAAEIFADLYRAHPLEFRFGIRLALCLQAMEAPEEMARVVDHLNGGWRKAAEGARTRLAEIAAIARERRQARRDEEVLEDDEDRRPGLFNGQESHVIRQLRAIARGNPQALDSLTASIAMARGDHQTALEHLEKARDSDTPMPGFHLQIGNAYLELKRFDEADASYRRALELDPENPNAYVGLGRVALKRRRNREALRAAQTAVGLKYHAPAAHFFHGIAQMRCGETEGAQASLRLALSQNPNFPEAHRGLARLYRFRLKDEDQAEKHRAAARAIVDERRRAAATRPRPDLPPLDAVDPEAMLPAFPEAPEGDMLPSLAMAPTAQPDTNGEVITVVSGLPRSGTSMMMQMLAAGGLPILSDEERTADESNPRGYFELDKARRLMQVNDWLDEARGKALKVVAPLVPFLPQACRYRVILMMRDLGEIVTSQRGMLERLERAGADLDEAELSDAMGQQLVRAKALLAGHEIPLLLLSYSEVLADPVGAAGQVAAFLETDLDEAAMAGAVDPALRRQRSGA